MYPKQFVIKIYKQKFYVQHNAQIKGNINIQHRMKKNSN